MDDRDDLITRLRNDLEKAGILTALFGPLPDCDCRWERSETFEEVWLRTQRTTLCKTHRTLRA